MSVQFSFFSDVNLMTFALFLSALSARFYQFLSVSWTWTLSAVTIALYAHLPCTTLLNSEDLYNVGKEEEEERTILNKRTQLISCPFFS